MSDDWDPGPGARWRRRRKAPPAALTVRHGGREERWPRDDEPAPRRSWRRAPALWIIAAAIPAAVAAAVVLKLAGLARS